MKSYKDPIEFNRTQDANDQSDAFGVLKTITYDYDYVATCVVELPCRAIIPLEPGARARMRAITTSLAFFNDLGGAPEALGLQSGSHEPCLLSRFEIIRTCFKPTPSHTWLRHEEVKELLLPSLTWHKRWQHLSPGCFSGKIMYII